MTRREQKKQGKAMAKRIAIIREAYEWRSRIILAQAVLEVARSAEKLN